MQAKCGLYLAWSYLPGLLYLLTCSHWAHGSITSVMPDFYDIQQNKVFLLFFLFIWITVILHNWQWMYTRPYDIAPTSFLFHFFLFIHFRSHIFHSYLFKDRTIKIFMMKSILYFNLESIRIISFVIAVFLTLLQKLRQVNAIVKQNITILNCYPTLLPSLVLLSFLELPGSIVILLNFRGNKRALWLSILRVYTVSIVVLIKGNNCFSGLLTSNKTVLFSRAGHTLLLTR